MNLSLERQALVLVEGTDIYQFQGSSGVGVLSALYSGQILSLATIRWRMPRPALQAICRLLLGVFLISSGVLLTSVPQRVFADQSDPQLPQLFEQLRQAQSPGDARSLESEIWQTWLVAPDDDSDKLLRATVDALGQRDFREALLISSELVEGYPDYAEGWNKRATIYYLMGNFDSSVTDIGETLRREPRHFGAISGLGLIFQAQGNLEASLDAFEQVLEISPQSLNAQRSVQQLKQQLGREI